MKRKKGKKRDWKKELIVLAITLLILFIYNNYSSEIEAYANNYFNVNIVKENSVNEKLNIKTTESFNLDNIPEYSGSPYVIINDNIPNFSNNDYANEEFEFYSDLDELGRCGVAYANICKEIQPKIGEERGNISSIHPSGWKNKNYKKLGGFIYNRCHLIGWQLSAENDNPKNLITGTKYMNVDRNVTF